MSDCTSCTLGKVSRLRNGVKYLQKKVESGPLTISCTLFGEMMGLPYFQIKEEEGGATSRKNIHRAINWRMLLHKVNSFAKNQEAALYLTLLHTVEGKSTILALNTPPKSLTIYNESYEGDTLEIHSMFEEELDILRDGSL